MLALTGIVGVAPGWPLRSEKVIYDDGTLTNESVICGIDAASYTRVDGIKGNDVGVANLSLGAQGPPDDGNCGYTNGDALHQAVCRARDRGLVLVASAGNEHSDFADLPALFCDPPCGVRPAMFDEVLTVTAMAFHISHPVPL